MQKIRLELKTVFVWRCSYEWKNSPSHISEMLIQGSTMGIVDITKKINEYPNADKDIIDLANKLLKFEQDNVEECKKYL